MTTHQEGRLGWLFQPRALVFGVLIAWMLLSVFCHAPLRQELFVAQHGLPVTGHEQLATACASAVVPPTGARLDSALLALLVEQQLQLPPGTLAATAAKPSLGGAVSEGMTIRRWSEGATRLYAFTVDGLLARLFLKGPAFVYAHSGRRPAEICGDGKQVEHWLGKGRSECNIALFEKFETFCTTMQWCLLGAYVVWLLCFSRDVRTYVNNTIQWPAHMPAMQPPSSQPPSQPPSHQQHTTGPLLPPTEPLPLPPLPPPPPPPPPTRITPGGPVRVVSLQRKAAAAATAAAILKQRHGATQNLLVTPPLPDAAHAVRPFSI
jgi:hypothetical protein